MIITADHSDGETDSFETPELNRDGLMISHGVSMPA
jgi:hypothetical protein